MSMEEALRRFELGESRFAVHVPPVEASALADLALQFAQEYAASGDLRYLNAVLKIIDRADYATADRVSHGRDVAWADSALADVARRLGIA